MEINQDTNINIDEALENARPTLPPADELGESIQVQAGTVEDIIKPTEEAQPLPTYPPQNLDEPETSGIILTNEEIKAAEEKPQAVGSMEPDILKMANEYLENNEEDFNEAQKAVAEFDPRVKQQLEREAAIAARQKEEEEEEAEGEEEEEEESNEEFNKNYDSAVVVINKMNETSPQFTPEERAKLSRVNKIKVEEVELVSLQTLRTRKPKKNTSVDKIIKRHSSSAATPIVLTASGYTATIAGASTNELVTVLNSSENALIDAQSRWSIIHSKLVSTSIPGLVEDFNKFLKATAFTDYNMFLYGMLLSTYPDKDTVPLTCDNEDCGQDYEHEYSPRELLRVEKMVDSQVLHGLVAGAVNNSTVEENAVEFHQTAPVNNVKAIRLPVSGHILEVYVQSAHDFIHKTIAALDKNEEERYAQAAMLATIVNRILVIDPDSEDISDPEYIEYADPMDITKIIYSLKDKDILTLSNQGDMLTDIAFDFGLMNVECPHCGKQHNTIPVEIEQMLFYQYQRAMSTIVE